MSKTALGMGLPVTRSLMTPCMSTTRPFGAGFWMMVDPLSRNGASGDQKGPRIAEDVGSISSSEMILCAISSTRLKGGKGEVSC